MAFVTATITSLRFCNGVAIRGGGSGGGTVICLAKKRGGGNKKRDKKTPRKRGIDGGVKASSSLPDGELDLVRAFESDENVTPLRPGKRKSKKTNNQATTAMADLLKFDKDQAQFWVTRATWAGLGILVGWFVVSLRVRLTERWCACA